MEPQRLTDDELRILVRLLHRFAVADMDQFENWRFPTEYGEVYVSMSRAPIPPAVPDSYDDLGPWLADPD